MSSTTHYMHVTPKHVTVRPTGIYFGVLYSTQELSQVAFFISDVLLAKSCQASLLHFCRSKVTLT